MCGGPSVLLPSTPPVPNSVQLPLGDPTLATSGGPHPPPDTGVGWRCFGTSLPHGAEVAGDSLPGQAGPQIPGSPAAPTQPAQPNRTPGPRAGQIGAPCTPGTGHGALAHLALASGQVWSGKGGVSREAVADAGGPAAPTATRGCAITGLPAPGAGGTLTHTHRGGGRG